MEINQLREVVRSAVDATSLRHVAREIDVTHGTVDNFLNGSTPYGRTLRKIRQWAAEDGEVGHEDGGEGLDGQLDAIDSADVDGWQKILRTEAVAAAYRARAIVVAAEAAKESALAARIEAERAPDRSRWSVTSSGAGGKPVDDATVRQLHDALDLLQRHVPASPPPPPAATEDRPARGAAGGGG